ncbi:prepilin signal peptidase PulO-like enzyme (type II secretory pathway) [Erwinia toletana]|uniref:Prepilin leader peptidase/N-methyltransferase n=1 Tax=Winslowiella toletana TaxID=92490 RepID=A0ABS4P7I1_9GAMM|nr:A24 family peptidase [Winslowiella toletana]MBP2168594.1 prepilin signal peptidase PulO-like enzyme (type II secretory pathway) [Winslowiella toletana]
MDNWLLVAPALIIGALLGSFLGLAIERFPACATGRCWLQRLCHPASRCNCCGHPLRLADLLPLISWLWLRGRCRYCRQAIGAYPCYIELLTGLLLALLAIGCQRPALFAWLTLFSCAAAVLSEIDRRHLLLPDVLTLPLLWCGLLFNLQLSCLHLQQAVSGAICGYLSFWLLSWLYRLARKHEGLGRGDSKYFAAIGAWTGVSELPLVATLAAATGIAIWLGKKVRCEKTILQPFGPCLSIAGWLVLIAQQNGETDWLNWLF